MLFEDVTSVIVITAVNTSNWSIYGKVGLLTDGEDIKTMLIFSSIYHKTRMALSLRAQLTGKSETLERGCESGNTAQAAGAGSGAKLATTGWLLRSSLVVTMATGVTELLFVGLLRPPLCWFPLQYKSTYNFCLVHSIFLNA
jgi:hypothetical protein